MKRYLAIFLVTVLIVLLWYMQRDEMSAREQQATVVQQVQGLGCSEISCDATDKVLVVPMDPGRPWSCFCKGIDRSFSASAHPPAYCIGTSGQGNLEICPLMRLGADCSLFDETWSLLLVHFGEEGVTTCRAGIRPDAGGDSEPSAHLATLKKIPWEQFGTATEEWDDWLGFRPEKHVLVFSMSDDCPLAKHLPQLKSLFRACERLGNETPVFRRIGNRRVLINRGNAVLFHPDIRSELRPCVGRTE